MVVEILAKKVRPTNLDAISIQTSRGAGAQQPSGITLASKNMRIQAPSTFLHALYILGQHLDRRLPIIPDREGDSMERDDPNRLIILLIELCGS